MINRSLIISSFKYSELIKLNDIVFCIANGSYSEIILQNKRKVCISKNLRWLEERIDMNSFFRVHKSYLINLQYVCKIFHDENKIQLKNGIYIPLSKYKKQEFWEKINLYSQPR